MFFLQRCWKIPKILMGDIKILLGGYGYIFKVLEDET